ncbi:MAG: hypothetical protein ACI4DY_00735 [Monoglobaceae bacterium]
MKLHTQTDVQRTAAPDEACILSNIRFNDCVGEGKDRNERGVGKHSLLIGQNEYL